MMFESMGFSGTFSDPLCHGVSGAMSGATGPKGLAQCQTPTILHGWVVEDLPGLATVFCTSPEARFYCDG